MNPTDLVTPAVIIALGIGVTQILKYADTNNVFKRFYPFASFLIGLILSFLFHFNLLTALTTSLAIAGTYDTVAYTIIGKGSKPSTPTPPETTSGIYNP